MANRFRSISELLCRAGILIIVIVGLAGQPAVTGAVTACEADCPMHHDVAPEMDCCAMVKACDSSAAAAGAQHQPSAQSTGSVCDDLSCFDSTADSTVLISSGTTFPKGGTAGVSPGVTIEVPPPVAVSVASPAFQLRSVSPPIYKRMCVYLI